MNNLNKILILVVSLIFSFREFGLLNAFTSEKGSPSTSSSHTSITFNDIVNDTKLLKDIAKIIINRPQALKAMKENLIIKHGQKSFALWRDHFDVNDTWGPAWDKLSPAIQKELLDIFGSKDTVKMIMKRNTFYLVSNNFIKKSKSYVETVVKNGTLTYEQSRGNTRSPHSIKIKFDLGSKVGVCYYKGHK